VREPDLAEAVDAALVVVAEVVGDQFEVLAVHIAAPDGPLLAVDGVAGELRALAVGGLQVLHALVADGEVKLAVRADVDAVDAVVVVETLETGEELLRRAVGLEVTVGVLEDEDVRRLADEDLVSLAVRVRRDADADGGDEFLPLVEGLRLVR